MSIKLTTSWNPCIKLIRLIDGHLQAIQCDLALDLNFDPRNDDQQHHRRLLHMRIWINEILDGAVAFSIHDEIDTSMLGDIANQIMFCPDEPHDFLLLALITSKLNAIGGGYVTITNSTIAVDTSDGFLTALSGDTDHLLPSGDEWMGQVRYWQQPWWNRSDGGMIDLPLNEGDDPEIKPDILISFDDDPALPINVDGDPSIIVPQDGKTAEIIRPNFRRRSNDD
jgi:hypothetical protein